MLLLHHVSVKTVDNIDAKPASNRGNSNLAEEIHRIIDRKLVSAGRSKKERMLVGAMIKELNIPANGVDFTFFEDLQDLTVTPFLVLLACTDCYTVANQVWYELFLND